VALAADLRQERLPAPFGRFLALEQRDIYSEAFAVAPFRDSGRRECGPRESSEFASLLRTCQHLVEKLWQNGELLTSHKIMQ
jgi:hypothetical protein